MKYSFTLLLFLMLMFKITSAQNSFIINFPTTVDTTTGTGQLIDIDGSIINTTTDTVQIQMSIVEQNTPYDLLVLLCDSLSCFLTSSLQFTIFPLDSVKSGVEFDTGMHSLQNGSVTLKFENLNDLTDSIIQSFKLIYKPPNPTGIEENNRNKQLLRNYPNPFSTSTTIKYKLTQDIGIIVISDVTGKIIERIEVQKEKEDIKLNTFLLSGIYFYYLIENGTITAKNKMIVQ